MTATQPAGNVQSARVVVKAPDGTQDFHEITPENNLIIGSSPNCSVRIEDQSVSSMHCLISLQDGRLSVQDWYTAGGTFLNGERLNTPSSFGPGDDIRVGEYRISADFEAVVSSAPAATGEDDSPSLASQLTDAFRNDDGETTGEEPLDDDDPLAAVRALRTEFVDGELDSLRKRVTELEFENEELRQAQSEQADVHFDDAADPFDREMLDLLKAEVEELQSEVTQRDARIAELIDGKSEADEVVDSSETEALVERLETMLAELEAGDERVATLQDLLQAADEATRAEQDERRQLSAWASEIEERVAQRESDWQAQQEALNSQIDEMKQERQRFDEQLRDITRRQGTTAQAQLITELRAKIDELTEQVKQTEDARDALQAKIDDVEFQKTDDGQKERLEEMLREERLKMAQDRADITRERAELTRMKTEMEVRGTSGARKIDDATCRVQAFREHLKDLNGKNKKSEKPEAEKTGLAARLSRLWKRLEG